jgi:hypothetical protein
VAAAAAILCSCPLGKDTLNCFLGGQVSERKKGARGLSFVRCSKVFAPLKELLLLLLKSCCRSDDRRAKIDDELEYDANKKVFIISGSGR